MSKTANAPKAKAGSNGHSNGVSSSKRRVTLSPSKGDTSKGTGERLPILKTYKVYIGGKFPRTESGRYYQPNGADGKPLANMCLCSRKDVRNTVQAARKAQGGWAGRSAFNRSQILYRIGEMLEGRTAQFVNELMLHGATKKQAEAEVIASIDRCIYYAGWCDKYQQVFSSVNPVASSHFNFSVYEPTGVVGLVAPSESALLGLVSTILPIIGGGNTVVVAASENMPLPSITLAEVLATSDVPGGVVNILTGKRSELLKTLVQHMDVNALVTCDADAKENTFIQQESTANLKRTLFPKVTDWRKAEDPYFILDTQEVKTTWHPIEVGQSGGGGY